MSFRWNINWFFPRFIFHISKRLSSNVPAARNNIFTPHCLITDMICVANCMLISEILLNKFAKALNSRERDMLLRMGCIALIFIIRIKVVIIYEWLFTMIIINDNAVQQSKCFGYESRWYFAALSTNFNLLLCWWYGIQYLPFYSILALCEFEAM